MFGFVKNTSFQTSLSGCDVSLDEVDRFIKHVNQSTNDRDEKEAKISLMLLSAVQGLTSILSNMEVDIPDINDVLSDPEELPFYHHYAVNTVHAMVKSLKNSNKNQPIFYSYHFCIAFLNVLSTPIGIEGRQQRWTRLHEIHRHLYDEAPSQVLSPIDTRLLPSLGDSKVVNKWEFNGFYIFDCVDIPSSPAAEYLFASTVTDLEVQNVIYCITAELPGIIQKAMGGSLSSKPFLCSIKGDGVRSNHGSNKAYADSETFFATSQQMIKDFLK